MGLNYANLVLPLERILTHCAIKFWIHNCLRVEFSKRMLNSYNNLLQTSNLQLDFFTTFCWVKNITVWNLSIRRKKDPRGEQKSCFDVFPHTFKIFFKLNNLPTPPVLQLLLFSIYQQSITDDDWMEIVFPYLELAGF